AYEVVGVARDTRGVQFDGSDAKLIYLPLPDDRLANRPILVRTPIDAVLMTRTIDTLVASIDSNAVVNTSTLQERLRGTAPFLVSSLAAAVASSLGAL